MYFWIIVWANGRVAWKHVKSVIYEGLELHVRGYSLTSTQPKLVMKRHCECNQFKVNFFFFLPHNSEAKLFKSHVISQGEEANQLVGVCEVWHDHIQWMWSYIINKRFWKFADLYFSFEEHHWYFLAFRTSSKATQVGFYQYLIKVLADQKLIN